MSRSATTIERTPAIGEAQRSAADGVRYRTARIQGLNIFYPTAGRPGT